MQSTYSANTEIVVAGNSAGKLPITGIHIFGNSGKGKKPAIILHGTVHAREWIATLVYNSTPFVHNILLTVQGRRIHDLQPALRLRVKLDNSRICQRI